MIGNGVCMSRWIGGRPLPHPADTSGFTDHPSPHRSIIFSINPKVYWEARNVVDIKVVSDHLIPTGTGVMGEAIWSPR